MLVGSFYIFPITGRKEAHRGLGVGEGLCLLLPLRWPGVPFFAAVALSLSSSRGHLDTPSVFLQERQPGQYGQPQSLGI